LALFVRAIGVGLSEFVDVDAWARLAPRLLFRCGSKVRRSRLYIFLIDEDSSTDAGKNITGNITQKGPSNLANLLILAPRPGLEPGTCGLTVRPVIARKAAPVNDLDQNSG